MNIAHRQIDRLLVLGLFLFIGSACGQTQSCGCGEPAPYPSSGLLVDQGIQLRLSENGVDKLESAVVPIILEQMGGALSFCLPPQDTFADFCHRDTACDDGSTGCQFDMGIGAIDISPIDNGPGTAAAETPDQIGALISVDQFDEHIPFDILLSSCDAHAYVDTGDSIDVTATLSMLIGEDGRLSFRYDGVEVDLDELQLDITRTGGIGLSCWIADAFSGLIKDLVRDQFAPVIESTVQSFLCQQCAAGCPADATCNNDTGFCERDGSCVPIPLGTEGRVDIMQLLASLAGGAGGLPSGADLYYSLFAANYADALREGISLAMQTGTTSESHSCVPYQEPPSAEPVTRSVELEADLSPSQEPYDTAVGISERFLEHAFWAVYNSGAICLEVDSQAFPELSSAALGFLLPSLSRLTENQVRPVLIKLSPKQAPTVTISRGEISVDENGTPTLLEPLIMLELHNLDIDIMLFAYDRFARILTVNADVDLPLGLMMTPDNALLPVLGDLENAITRLEVRNAELVAEPASNIEALLPTLIAGFLPQLAGVVSQPFPIPELMGFSLTVHEMSGIDCDENDTQCAMIGLFADLDYIPTGGLSIAADTHAYVKHLELPVRRFLRPDGSLDSSKLEHPSELYPVVELALDASVPDGREAEFSVRVDRGLWSQFSRDRSRTLRDPALLLPGRHTISVRSRLVDDYRSLDPSPELIDLVIDWSAPHIEGLRSLDDALVVLANDDVSTPSTLSYRLSFGEQAWTEWRNTPTFAIPSALAGRQLQVRVQVRDEAGNQAQFASALTVQGEAPIEAPEAGASCACSMQRGSSLSLWWLFVPFAVLALRRKRSWAWLAALFAILLGSGCDETATQLPPDVIEDQVDTEEDQAKVCVPACTEFFDCVDGVCEPVHECDEDSECGPGEHCYDGDGDGRRECVFDGCLDRESCSELECEDGLIPLCEDYACVCGTPCAEGCVEGEFCCHSSNSCVALPEACASIVCDPGFELVITGEVIGDPKSCEIADAQCECVELPALPMGRYGQYSNLASLDGELAMSCYNSTYGDLMIGFVDEEGAPVWTFLDGVPADAEVVGSVNGPRGGIKEHGVDVGKYSDVAIGADGSIHVSYQDVDAGTLRYALGIPGESGEYTWQFQTIDDNGRTGYWTSISIDPYTGAPGIAYSTLEQVVDAAVFSELRFAQANSAQPTQSDWLVQVLDRVEVTQVCAQPCESGQFCRVDTASCAFPSDPASCPPCAENERCFGGSCLAIAEQANEMRAWPLATGLHSSQARYADGRVAVAYYDAVWGRLMLVRQRDGVAFDAPIILAGEQGNAGLWPSIAIDASDVEHLVYVDWSKKELRYMQLGLLGDLVDGGARVDAYGPCVNVVGDDASLILGEQGPVVVYQDSSLLQTNVARLDLDGSFQHQVVGGEGRGESFDGSHGFYADHCVDGSRAWVLSFVVNQQTTPISFTPRLLSLEL
ncbi:MAG: hypothetical protein RBU37_05775 [Myxococcota bacterium]|jgi:hypothetical protein|nr:hypothetical protein [Myxococcota bacterium]